MTRHQTVQQHKAIRRKVLTQRQINERHFLAQARQEVEERWMFPRMLLVLALLFSWLSLAHFTQFRAHMARWLVTDEIPTDWWAIAIYVVGFLLTGIIFIWSTKTLDQKVKGLIEKRYKKLLDDHYMVDEE